MVDLIGAGYGRTGTASLQRALEILGYQPCHHMREVVMHPETAPRWAAAVNGDTAQLADLLSGFRATTDFPSCVLWRELMDLYPEAKVVLTVRDPKKWYDSARATILDPELRRARDNAEATGGPSDRPRPAAAMQVLGKALATKGFDADLGEQELISGFLRHNEAVRTTVDADKLLVYEVSQGWEPLCGFLGVDVPDEPFPRVNDTMTFRQNVERMLDTGVADFT